MSPEALVAAQSPPSGLASRAAGGALVVLLVSFSGFCSLVYQVVWDRSVRTNFGGDNVSSAIVTGTFLLGLGLGAVLFGRNWRRPFHVYAAVEAAIGAYAIVSHALLGSLARVLAHGLGGGIETVESLRMPLVGACVLFLLPPCILMGGTLPLMFRCFVSERTFRSGTIGWLYGFNTLGAALGTIAAPFYLLSRFDVPVTLQLLGCGNLLLAAAILGAARVRSIAARAARDDAGEGEATPIASPSESSSAGAPSLLALQLVAFASGLVSLAYEVSLFRHLFVVNPNSPYNFPLVLAPYLLSIAIGSALFTRLRSDDASAALRRIAWLAVLSAIVLLAAPAIAGFRLLHGATVFDRPVDVAADLLYVFALAMPLPLLLSGVFPLLVRVATRSVEALPSRTGLVYVANSVGSFCGAILAQFVGFERLGAGGVLLGLELVCLVVAAWAASRVAPRRVLLFAGAAAGIWAISFALPRAAIEMAYSFGRPAIAHQDRPDLLDHVEGTTGVAMLVWDPSDRTAEVYVNGQYMSALPDHPDHVALAGVVLSKPDMGSILVLGLGGGGMVCELLKDPRVERVEIVDWSHELPTVLDFPRPQQILRDCLHDPRVRTWRADARVAVALYESGQFDVVLDNLTIPDWVGSTAIRSVEYFREVKRLLAPDGMYISNNHGFPYARFAVRRGLAETFDELWVHPRSIVVASDGDPGFTPESVEAAFASRGEILKLEGPPYASFVLDEMEPTSTDDLKRVPPIRDDRLIHEYRFHSLPEFLRRWRRD